MIFFILFPFYQSCTLLWLASHVDTMISVIYTFFFNQVTYLIIFNLVLAGYLSLFFSLDFFRGGALYFKAGILCVSVLDVLDLAL